MEIQSPGGNIYIVQKPLGETRAFRLYQCVAPENRECILKIAATADDNSIIDREAFLLQRMRQEADRLQQQYVKEAGENKFLNYHFCFPGLVESFISDEQGGRRVSILSFFDIAKELVELVPIAHLSSRDHVRIDPKTSAWMLGKLLKILVFAHDLGIEVKNLTGENVLINRGQHFVAVFDWTEAVIGSADIPISDAQASVEIAQATQTVVLALGGNIETGEIPPDPQLEDESYGDILKKLCNGEYQDAATAHSEFYRLVRSLWPKRGFHPFTAYPVD